jgi:hypothetical protein
MLLESRLVLLSVNKSARKVCCPIKPTLWRPLVYERKGGGCKRNGGSVVLYIYIYIETY